MMKNFRFDHMISASCCRQVDAESAQNGYAAYHEKPSVTLERLARLENIMVSEIEAIKKLLIMKQVLLSDVCEINPRRN